VESASTGEIGGRNCSRSLGHLTLTRVSLKTPTLILVGNPNEIHIGAHLLAGADELGYPVRRFNSEEAFAGNRLVARMNWWMRGRRPNCLREFSDRIVQVCQAQRPEVVVSTGISPIDEAALRQVGEMGVKRCNYLTDDPWNPTHRAPWFLRALQQYDHIFSPRRSIMGDLHAHGCRTISYLPFAYAPELHFSDPPFTPDEVARYSSDVVFAGGADSDRVAILGSLIRQGFQVALYGGYWERHSITKRYALGHADPSTLRKAIAGAKVALCLVRRANRDGHSMRTFEVAAMGACMLAEYTKEHEEILGPDGEAAVYFRSESEMVDRLRWLLDNEKERQRLRAAVQIRITGGRNTYKDRLETMLAIGAET